MTISGEGVNLVHVGMTRGKDPDMITEDQARDAIANRTRLRDFDGQTGIPQEMDTDGETVVVRIVDGADFSRWSDLLDLSFVPADDHDEAERTARADQVQAYNLAAAESARQENEAPGGMYHGTRWASNA